MNKKQTLLNYFQALAINKNSQDPIVPIEHKVNFIQQCKNLELAILGIEGFEYSSTTITADENLIADFSELDKTDWGAFCSTTYRLAENFFTEFPEQKSYAFSFVVAEA